MQAAVAAFGVTALQVVLACAASGELNPGTAYLRLCEYDSLLYADIVDRGYVCPPSPTPDDHGNVAFFPAYPVSARLVRALTGWTTAVSLIVAAQLACWGFWTYVFLLFERWRVPPRLVVLGCALMATRPTAFFLVTAYSEPLFLMSLLGFIYWSGETSPAGRVLAALHGFVVSATRIVGIPVAVYPVLHAWLSPSERPGVVRRLAPAFAVAAAAALGGGLFFLYCQHHFGAWDLYLRTQALGWKVRPDYFVFVHGDAYDWAWPQWKYGFYEPNWFSHMTALFFPPLFAAFIAAEVWLGRSGASGWRERAGLYAVAWIVYYLSVAGVSRLGMVSMARYVLAPEILLVLCLVHMLSRPGLTKSMPTWLRVALAVWALVGLAYEVVSVIRFMHGRWVA